MGKPNEKATGNPSEKTEAGKPLDVATESLARGNVVEAGDIHTINDPEDMETVCAVNMALVIQFESVEAIRKAMSDGKCEFTLFEANVARQPRAESALDERSC